MSRRPDERVARARLALEAAEFVEEAAAWAHRLVMDEAEGPGDFVDAMHRVAAKFEIAYATLWNSAVSTASVNRSSTPTSRSFARMPLDEATRRRKPNSARLY